jgi:hypothetical protein
MQEIADHHLNRQVMPGVGNKEMEAAKIDPAAQNSLKEEVESAQVETESETSALWSTLDYVQSLSATLVALTALSLLGLFFFVLRVTSVFSGGRKSANRRRRR